MKKLLGIVVLVLLLSTNSNADLYELKIDLEKPEITNSPFILKNGHSSKCNIRDFDIAASITVGENTETANVYMDLEVNHFVKQNKILSEIYFEVRAEGEVGSMKLDYSTPIKKNGSTGKSKFIKKDLRGDKDFQNEFKPYVNAFKAVGDMLFTEASRNPEYGKPLSNISFDGRQTFKKMINAMAKSMPQQSKEIKKAASHIVKNSKMPISKNYIGYSFINGEKYYLVEYNFKINYTGNIPEYRNFTNEFKFEQIAFFHAETGLPSVVYDIVENNDTWMNHKMVCGIYKNDSLISEISVPMLMDASQLKKIKKKSKVKTDNNDLIKQLKALNELYKSGALTKEEFEKAKNKLLN
tara:strand:- start:53 stop:1114 length:1062 start_codon:yes stop_codon:yes gene_type:complete